MSSKKSLSSFLFKAVCLVVLVPIFALLGGCGELNIKTLERKLNSSYFEPLVTEFSSDKLLDEFYSLEYESEGWVSMAYRIHIPEAYKARGKGLPLVVFLHGSGGRGYNNVYNVAGNTLFNELIFDEELSSELPAVLVAPQCPASGSWAAIATDVNELIKRIVNKLNIDKNRVYVTGLSMGGNGTFEVLADEPDLYTAAIPICGWAGTTTIAPLIKDIPIWVFHAADDGTVSVSNSRNIVSAIEKAGGTKVKYTEYPTGDHGIWGTVYSNHEHIRWLFEQVKE